MLTKLLATGAQYLRIDPVAVTEAGFDIAAGDTTAAGLTFVAALVAPSVGAATGTVRSVVMRAFKRTRDGAPSPEKFSVAITALHDQRTAEISDRLGEALGGMLQYSDPDEVRQRIWPFVEQWRSAYTETGDVRGLPSDNEIINILCDLLRNLREASYRELFAERYVQPINAHRLGRSRIERVFTNLRSAPTNDNDPPTFLDFRSKSANDIVHELRQAGNLVIVGEPGSGKSTLLRFLAAQCARSDLDEALLPMFLRLKEYATQDERLVAEYARLSAEAELQLVLEEGFFERALANGQCLVCFDASDEVASQDRLAVMDNIKSLVARYPDNRYIITSRNPAYGERPPSNDRFRHLYVQPMDDVDLYKFIDTQFDDIRGRDVRAFVDSNPGVRALVTNPLLMTILGLVNYDTHRARLPLTRAEFYEAAVDVLLRDEDDDGRKTSAHSVRQHGRILSQLAYQLQSAEQTTITRDGFESFASEMLVEYYGITSPSGKAIDEIKDEAASLVSSAETRSGLLVEEWPGSREVRFWHNTFREYLAAQDIRNRHARYGGLRCDVCWEEIEGYIGEEHWWQVILHLLESLNESDCTQLTERILAEDDGTPDPAGYRFPY